MPRRSDVPTQVELTLSGLGDDGSSHPRRDLGASLEVLPLDGRQPWFWCKADNLSHRGIFLRTRRSLPLGALVVLKLHMRGCGTLWRLTAEIVHQVREFGLGCRFIDVHPEAAAVIGKLVAWCAAAPMQLRTVDRGGTGGRVERIPSIRWREAVTSPWRRRR